MNLDAAKRVAETIVERLRPLCQRIEIAGSIRRGRPEVGDIDLVVLAADVEAVKRRCLERCQTITNGDQNFIVRMPGGLQVDIFFARGPLTDMFAPQPSNWASLLVLRTGSREHNIFLVEKARALGLRWDPYRGVLDPDGYVISGEDEGSIYNALGMPLVEPRFRELEYMTEHFPLAAPRQSQISNLKSQKPAPAPAPPAAPTAAGLAALAELHALGESLKPQEPQETPAKPG